MFFVRSSISPIFQVLCVVIPMLLTVAYVTVAERKTMANMQRRLGPNEVGFFGLLQAFADALKLILKEYIAPSQSNLILFFLGPIITLIFSLLAFAVVPYGPGIAILDFNLGIIYILAVSSIATYGILLAGWSANSKYAFLGSLRSTAQLISYELILTSAVLLIVFLTGSLNLIVTVETQRVIWFIFPLFPVFVIFFIGSIAETNRAPFDLAEAESELVSGFMTEHAAVIFVFFFLAEYASIVLMCMLTVLFFLGGYLYDLFGLLYPLYNGIFTTVEASYEDYLSVYYTYSIKDSYFFIFLYSLFYSLSLGLKTCIMVFTFIWVRASFPRIRYDQLMSFCWMILLPLVISFIIVLPCILYGFNVVPANITVM